MQAAVLRVLEEPQELHATAGDVVAAELLRAADDPRVRVG
jgi:hypothetical protein